jgi:hypothetical protein
VIESTTFNFAAQNTRKSFRIILLRRFGSLTPLESHSYKNMGDGGALLFRQNRFSLGSFVLCSAPLSKSFVALLLQGRWGGGPPMEGKTAGGKVTISSRFTGKHGKKKGGRERTRPPDSNQEILEMEVDAEAADFLGERGRVGEWVLRPRGGGRRARCDTRNPGR